MPSSPITFIDLAAQQARLRPRIERAISEVLDEGAYVMGPQVKAFERELAEFCGAKHVVSCANGTDALVLALMALGVGGGDAVFVPSFTFAATAEVVPIMGAVPVFVDSCRDTFNMDVLSFERAIDHARSLGLTPRAVIPVDLFGLPADIDAIGAVAASHGIELVCDSAQGFGGTIGGRMTGTLGRITTTSFFPAKPLGCYGDGGALFTDDPDLAILLDSLRVHGKGSDKYDNVRIGTNSRLDTIQAAILQVKLAAYAEEIVARNEVANRYSAALADIVQVPVVPEGYGSVWAQYTVVVPSNKCRSQIQTTLAAAGVPTAVYYPMPLHQQSVYRGFPSDPSGLAAAESLSRTVLSLPMHPYLDGQTQGRIIEAFRAAIVGAQS